MSSVDKNGMLISPKITLWRFPNIEHGAMNVVHGIIIHQTFNQPLMRMAMVEMVRISLLKNLAPFAKRLV
jgi:hypothetical protein